MSPCGRILRFQARPSGKPEPGSEADLTVDLTPAPPAEPETKRDAPIPPAAFGRYRVRNALGAGGFGAVYLGHDTQLDRPVAIKVLRGGPEVPQAEAERFLQEARRLAQLSHPGIMAVHDVGIDGGHVYLVSDFLDGPDLGRWLGDHRPAWPEAARIAAAVADALAHAHARLIVHRDVKPANIILTTDRGPVLVDFGLGLDEARAGGSELGVISGTPAYMAPEQVAGAAHRIDGRTDIYSLGVVLYGMLCGHLPFRASKTGELLRQVSDDEPQPPRQLRPEIPPELERVCLKALAKRVHDRYTTAGDFADDLRRACQAEAGLSVSTSSGFLPAAIPTGETRASWSAPSPPSSQSSTSSRRRAREAERRQVTVLVCGCSLFESEAYLEDLDAEDQAGMLRDFRQSCEQAVFRFDGTVVQCNEEGLLACFGYPVAYEDAARRAALAGLGLLENVKALGERLRRGQSPEMNPWVGIHTGPAVVEAGEESVSLVGEARIVAVRLKDVAEAGQVVCTGPTHQLLRSHFECDQPRPAASSRAWRSPPSCSASRPSPRRGIRSRRRGRPGSRPLTGRDHEINLLKDRWEQAQEGMGQVVLLIGEPGLGKSRLVYTLKEHVLGQMVEGGGGRARHRVALLAALSEHRAVPGHRILRAGPRLRPRGAAAGPVRPAAPPPGAVRPGPAGDRAPVGVAAVAADPGPLPPARDVAGPAEGGDLPGPAGVAAHREPPAGRSCSSSRTCTGPTRRPWSSWGRSSPSAGTSRSSRCSPSAPSSRRPGPRSPTRPAWP